MMHSPVRMMIAATFAASMLFAAGSSHAEIWPAAGTRCGVDAFGTDASALATVGDGAGGHFVVWGDACGARQYQHLTADGQTTPGWGTEGLMVLCDMYGFNSNLGIDGRLHRVYWTIEFIGGNTGNWLFLNSAPDVTTEGLEVPGTKSPDRVAVENMSDGNGGGYRIVRYAELSSSLLPSVDGLSLQHQAANGDPKSFHLGYLPATHVWGLLTDAAHHGWVLSSPDPTTLRLHRMAPSGAPSTGWGEAGVRCVEGSDTIHQARFSLYGTQGVMVAWSNANGIFFKRIASGGGGALAAPTEVPGALPGDELFAVQGSGSRLHVAWRRGNELYSQVCDGSGQPLTPDGSPHLLASNVGEVRGHGMLAMPGNGAMVVWGDERLGPGRRLRTLRLDGDGQPLAGWPAEGRLVSSIGGQQSDCVFRLENGVISFVWVETGRGGGTAREVYMTRVTLDGVTVAVDATSPHARLAILSQQPLAGAHGMTFRLALPDPAPARLEAFDLAGRRVASTEVVPSHGGEATAELRVPKGPGVWFVRLTQSEHRVTTRMSIPW